MSKQLQTAKRLDRLLPYILVVAGLLALLASFIITYEKIELLKNPNYHPICSLNPIISCGSVMESKQASVLGFPNSLMGIAGFAAVAMIGGAMLAGATFKRWFWICAELGVIFGLGFVHYLFFQSVYRIHALCPFCMAVWVCNITIFVYLTLYNLQHGYLKLPAVFNKGVTFTQRHHGDILASWLLIIAVLILHHFWYYFGQHL